nr:MAG TPA: hypothetical protein [Bacteriophage sp.]
MDSKHFLLSIRARIYPKIGFLNVKRTSYYCIDSGFRWSYTKTKS